MASIVERAKQTLATVRERRPFVDHLIRMQQHYGKIQGSQQAGAITYFGFLSFFPILALAFFVVGYVARVYPDAEQNLIDGIQQVLPGLVGTGPDEISLTDIQDAAGAVGLIGLAGVIYSGLGWLSSLRDALILTFEEPAGEKPNFVFGKLRDLLTLALIGTVLVVSVAVSSVVTTYSDKLLDLIGLDQTLSPLLTVLSISLGLAASSLLFFALFRLLAAPPTPRRPMWQGALLGAIGFEILKQLSRFLLASTKGQPAFQAFGIALILVVWINYFSRVVLYAAAFAHTSSAARHQREIDADANDAAVSTPDSVMAAAHAASYVDPPRAAITPDHTPDHAGAASGAAAAQAHHDRIGSRHRLMALGATASAAGLAALAVLRRKS